jgi:regulator of sigma D
MPSYLYRCEARSVDAFLSQLIRYISSGHYFYITGRIPDRKDPAAVDEKLIALYDIAKPRWANAANDGNCSSGIRRNSS